jgi:hypothetical protein
MYKQVTVYIRERVSVPDEALEKAFCYSRMVRYKKGDPNPWKSGTST